MKPGVPTIPIDKSRYVSDGFGSVWPPCPVCNAKMMIVRPGYAVCPRETEHETPYDQIDSREKGDCPAVCQWPGEGAK